MVNGFKEISGKNHTSIYVSTRFNALELIGTHGKEGIKTGFKTFTTQSMRFNPKSKTSLLQQKQTDAKQVMMMG